MRTRAWTVVGWLCGVGLVACGGDDTVSPAPSDAGLAQDGTLGKDSEGVDSGPPDTSTTTDARSDAADPSDAMPPPPGDAGPGGPFGGCTLFPKDFIFNTPIDKLPVDPNSAAYLATIGSRKVHLDLGTQPDQTKPAYYGIPYNVVKGNQASWVDAHLYSADPSLTWDPRAESDCTTGPGQTLYSPCVAKAVPTPSLPISSNVLVEGGIDKTPSQPYGDHHILIVDSDTCRLWETYHSYPDAKSGWDVFNISTWDLASSALRKDGWTSADAAGFPILPLLLKAVEAQSGVISHAMRFTIQSSKIRKGYVWPARHLTSNGTTSTNLPPMGQLFRLKASYSIPGGWHTQSKAIAQALKTYGMYIADGGSDLFVTGEPSASWDANIFGEVQSIMTSDFEAVDISAITKRAGFDPNSGAVPP